MQKNDKLVERNILKIIDYAFQDGEGIRDKYLIVLNKNDDEAYLLHTLTTTNPNGFDPKKIGCQRKGNISYFYFPSGIVVGESGFSFKSNTFVFFTENIRKEKLISFSKYAEKNIQYVDIMTKKTLKDIIDCMLNSDFINAEQADDLLKTRKKL